MGKKGDRHVDILESKTCKKNMINLYLEVSTSEWLILNTRMMAFIRTKAKKRLLSSGTTGKGSRWLVCTPRGGRIYARASLWLHHGTISCWAWD